MNWVLAKWWPEPLPTNDPILAPSSDSQESSSGQYLPLASGCFFAEKLPFALSLHFPHMFKLRRHVGLQDRFEFPESQVGADGIQPPIP